MGGELVVRRRVAGATAVLFVIGLAGCAGSDTKATSNPTASTTASTRDTGSAPAALPTTTVAHHVPSANAFDETDATLETRVQAAGLSGGMVRIVAADGSVIHDHAIGDVSATTPLAVASSSKWLTSATFMTFVDNGAIHLDDDISRWLPEFAGSNPPITPRQLLDHTSGVHDNPCQSDGSPLAACVRTLAVSPREFAAGSQFSYGNSPLLVIGRLVEVLGGADFATVVQERITGPLGMDDTTWPGAPDAANPAFGLRVTVVDYGKFLDMILHHGVSHGTRILSANAVSQMITNQVSGYDTTHDYSVGITQIPRYGLGCWVDVQDSSGQPVVVSGNGGAGFYPWVDFSTNTWGIVGVQDERGAQVAVPASQKVELAGRAALSG